MTITERLKEISERAEKATPGPWERPIRDYLCVVSTGESYLNGMPSIICDLEDGQRRDAEFIAHSRTDIPDLVEMLKVAVGALEKYNFRPKDADDFDVASEALTRLDEIARRGK